MRIRASDPCFYGAAARQSVGSTFFIVQFVGVPSRCDLTLRLLELFFKKVEDP